MPADSNTHCVRHNWFLHDSFMKSKVVAEFLVKNSFPVSDRPYSHASQVSDFYSDVEVYVWVIFFIFFTLEVHHRARLKKCRLGKCKTQQRMPYLPLNMAFYSIFALWGIQTQSCLNYVENSRFAIKRPPPGSHFFEYISSHKYALCTSPLGLVRLFYKIESPGCICCQLFFPYKGCSRGPKFGTYSDGGF